MSDFRKKTSGIIVSFVMGLLIISFMFSGFQGSMGGADTVASVGDHSIKIDEYRQALSQQMKMYSQFTGGKPLTNKQIERFGIKRNTVQMLINQKLQLTLADMVGISPSEMAIKDKIKSLPYFLTNKQFDLSKYKQLLAANRLTPSLFEEDVKKNLKLELASKVLGKFPVSKEMEKEYKTFKSMAVNVELAQVTNEAMLSKIKISQKEINDYLKKESNLARTKSLFKSRKQVLDQKEQVNASHILIKDEKKIKDLHKKLTASNFDKMAAKHTEEPNGKISKGSLGWFSRGRMVPEFDKIVFTMKNGQISAPFKTQFGWHVVLLKGKKAEKLAKFEDHKITLAKELIRKSKKDELKGLVSKVANEIETTAKQNKNFTGLIKKYDLSNEENVSIDPLEGSMSSKIRLSDVQISTIFKEKKSGKKVFKFVNPASTIIVKIKNEEVKTDKKEKDDSSEVLAGQYSRALQKDFIDVLKDEVKISVNNQFL